MLNAFLMRHVRWYRRWHHYRYHNAVHYLVFLLFVFYNFYLLLELQRVTSII